MSAYVLVDAMEDATYLKRWVHAPMCKRLDGSGRTVIRCQRATYRAFKFDKLPPPDFLNPESPSYTGGTLYWPIRNSNVAVRRFRIAYEEWPGHKKPYMASVSVMGPWINECYELIHRHLMDQGVPYLYLCNEHGNKLNDCWDSFVGRSTRQIPA